MIRVSREELIERWAMTYGEDGYDVRAKGVVGRAPPSQVNDVTPDIEAKKEHDRVLVRVIDSAECLDAPHTRRDLQALDAARGNGTTLHLVVAAECLSGLKDKIDHWNVHADTVHVT